MIRRFARPALALAVLLAACHEPEVPAPQFSVFGLSDKFFDVKTLGGGQFLALTYRSKVLKSTDGGQTWKKVSNPTQKNLTRMSFVDATRGWAVGHDGKIFATADAGTTWTEQQSGVTLPLFDLDFPTAEKGYAAGDVSTVVKTVDGGKTWTSEKVVMSTIGVREDMSLAITDPIFYSVDFIDENTGWVTGEFGQIRFTQDGGATWEAQHGTLLGTKFRDIMSLPTLLCTRFKDRMNGIAVGTYGAIITTVDGGVSWTFAESPVKTPLYDVQYLADGDALIVGSSGVIVRGSPEKGFKPVTVPAGVYSWIGSVDVDEKGIGVAAGAHGLILASTDFGNSWQRISFQ